MEKNGKKILVVAMIESIHTARSIELIADAGFRIFVVAATNLLLPHPKLEELRASGKVCLFGPFIPSFIRNPRLISLIYRIQRFVTRFAGRNFYLRLALKIVHPDIVQSMEVQNGAYPVLEVLKTHKKTFSWIVTNWGGELTLFSRFPEHLVKMQEILNRCDGFSCECERDMKLATKLGLKGKSWPIVPITGGMDTERLRLLGTNKNRFRIALKGYSGWSGRAIFGLKALELCVDKIRDKIQITVFSPTQESVIAVRLFEEKTGLKVEVLPNGTAHEKILQTMSESIVYVGLGISDGISTACIEAMATGAFPIQSNSSCCTEWFIPDQSGFAVDAEGISQLAEKIVFALEHADFVENARKINFEICKEKLDPLAIREKVVRSYNETSHQ